MLDDLSTGRMENLEQATASGAVTMVEGSVLDEALVDDCMDSVDVCFHLASMVGVQLVVSNPLDSLTRNVRGTDNVISSAARHNRRLLFTSTSEIYGKKSDGPLHEDSDRLLGSTSTARWTYSTAKAFGELLAFGLHRERGAENVVVRLFNTVGPRQTGAYGMVLPRLVRQAVNSEDLTVYGDGGQSRCFAHVLDTVAAILSLVHEDQALGGVFNVGSTTEVTILDLANRVIEKAGSESGIRMVEYEDAYGEGFEELGRRIPDTKALETLTGWTPRRSVDDAIDDTIAFERGQWSGPEVTPAAKA